MMFSDGYLYRCCLPGVMNIIRNAMTPIRPRNISPISISWQAVLSDGVRFIVRPTVLRAENDSKNNSIVSTSGMHSFMAMVLTTTAVKESAIVAYDFWIEIGEMRRPKISMLSLPMRTFRALRTQMANVVTFIPPPVDMGAHPIHMSSIRITIEAPDSVSRSMYMNPAVRALADKKKESMSLFVRLAPACERPASKIKKATVPKISRIMWV